MRGRTEAIKQAVPVCSMSAEDMKSKAGWNYTVYYHEFPDGRRYVGQTCKPMKIHLYNISGGAMFRNRGDFGMVMTRHYKDDDDNTFGFDYVGCELDKEYFAKGCERFDRECRGITVGENGQRYQQTALFDQPS